MRDTFVFGPLGHFLYFLKAPPMAFKEREIVRAGEAVIAVENDADAIGGHVTYNCNLNDLETVEKVAIAYPKIGKFMGGVAPYFVHAFNARERRPFPHIGEKLFEHCLLPFRHNTHGIIGFILHKPSQRKRFCALRSCVTIEHPVYSPVNDASKSLSHRSILHNI